MTSTRTGLNISFYRIELDTILSRMAMLLSPLAFEDNWA